MTACISRLPEDGYGANVSTWPARLQEPPQRLQAVVMDAYIAKNELFMAESRYWDDILASYVRAFHWKKMKLRNVMDMRAGFGGCEPFDTYPRTYDLLHAFGLFSEEQKRCNITSILLEMDRMLRPGGRAYIRDSKYIINDIQQIAEAMGWRTNLRDTAEGPYASRKILMCQKH
ncbi:hypothetical protein BHM03_00007461 [Ensete ventricosum]|nr:hypothetical protein BHM03_00007461 [Ensete ventricosum]